MILNPGDVSHGYQLEQWTQHWRKIGGHWYRDGVAVELATGIRLLVSFPDGEL